MLKTVYRVMVYEDKEYENYIDEWTFESYAEAEAYGDGKEKAGYYVDIGEGLIEVTYNVMEEGNCIEECDSYLDAVLALTRRLIKTEAWFRDNEGETDTYYIVEVKE